MSASTSASAIVSATFSSSSGRATVAELPGVPGAGGVTTAGRVEANDAVLVVDDQEPAADVDRGGRRSTWPRSSTASLVVPPPMSMFRMRRPVSCETFAAPEP